ncbi:MAG TPA: sugar transferase [Gemmatimonadales bacterium]|nr:sugar transferase [Gemmatimonadales bacterium]
MAEVVHEPGRERSRRIINVLVAALGLLASAPVLLLIALAIRLTSRGPIFYSQTRVGLDRRSDRGHEPNSRRQANLGGRPFRIYKFRTMRVQPPGQAPEVWATPDDPRVTTVGRVLRKFRLDELPQLWNVLVGDMNIVGPRPEQPGIFAELRQQIDGYHLRQRVRPGITGWAQVNHTYDQCLEDVRRKVSLDLEYVARHSVLEDLRIMALTVPVMVGRKGGW